MGRDRGVSYEAGALHVLVRILHSLDNDSRMHEVTR